MTRIDESTSGVLRIRYTVGWFRRMLFLVGAATCLGFVSSIVLFGPGDTSGSRYPSLAVPFLIILSLSLLVTGVFLVSGAFRQIRYDFDKASDHFRISGQRYFFRRLETEGALSDILSISHQIRETDDNTGSEIFLKYRYSKSVTETLKCGSGEVRDDDHITDSIQKFTSAQACNTP